MPDIVLSSAVRDNLLSLKQTADLQSITQGRLATGLKVNTALDNPNSFFTAQSLNDRASDLSNLLDNMGQGVQTIRAADKGERLPAPGDRAPTPDERTKILTDFAVQLRRSRLARCPVADEDRGGTVDVNVAALWRWPKGDADLVSVVVGKAVQGGELFCGSCRRARGRFVISARFWVRRVVLSWGPALGPRFEGRFVCVVDRRSPAGAAAKARKSEKQPRDLDGSGAGATSEEHPTSSLTGV